MPTADARLLADDPRALFGSASKMFAVPYAEIRELQLEALRYRFDALLPRVQLLDRLAERNGVDGIDDLATAGRLLYPSNVYKSYVFAWLIENEYARLTRWLQQLTDARSLRRRRRRRRLARRVVHAPGGRDRPPAVPLVVDVGEALVRPAWRGRMGAPLRHAPLRERGRRHRRRPAARLVRGPPGGAALLPPRPQRGDHALRVVHPGAHGPRRHAPRARAHAVLGRAELRPHGARGPACDPDSSAATRDTMQLPEQLLSRRGELSALLEGSTDRADAARSSPRPPIASAGSGAW